MAVTVGFELLSIDISPLPPMPSSLTFRGFRHFVDVLGKVEFVGVLLTICSRRRYQHHGSTVSNSDDVSSEREWLARERLDVPRRGVRHASSYEHHDQRLADLTRTQSELANT